MVIVVHVLDMVCSDHTFTLTVTHYLVSYTL
jgi:hypothetical protein